MKRAYSEHDTSICMVMSEAASKWNMELMCDDAKMAWLGRGLIGFQSKTWQSAISPCRVDGFSMRFDPCLNFCVGGGEPCPGLHLVIDRMHASVLEAKYCGLLLLCATDYLLVLANWQPRYLLAPMRKDERRRRL
jgi:hypothetical protein